MGQDAMIQFVYLPLIFLGLLSLIGLVVWLSRKRPNSLINRFARWWLSFVEVIMGGW